MSVVPAPGPGKGPWKKKATGRKKIRRGSSLIRLLVCLLIGILLYASRDNIGCIWEMYREKAALEQQVADMEAENGELAEKVRYMATDAWVEQAARDELGLVKPGEIVLIPADAD